MRLLFLVVSLMSFSSCIAVLGLGALTTTLAVTSPDAKRGAERDARQLALHAQEAAAIRQRYNEAERRSLASSPGPALQREPTAPPLVSVEPVRKPLRPRELTH
jgi:hypothetical protein